MPESKERALLRRFSSIIGDGDMTTAEGLNALERLEREVAEFLATPEPETVWAEGSVRLFRILKTGRWTFNGNVDHDTDPPRVVPIRVPVPAHILNPETLTAEIVEGRET